MTESIVAAGIAAILAIAVLGGAIVANAHFGPDPAQSAIDALVSRELAVAENLAKYRGPALQPTALQTMVPLPDGSPIPATLSLAVNAASSGQVQISITATARKGALTRTATASSGMLSPAPLPGTNITLGGLAPAPTGAP